MSKRMWVALVGVVALGVGAVAAVYLATGQPEGSAPAAPGRTPEVAAPPAADLARAAPDPGTALGPGAAAGEALPVPPPPGAAPPPERQGVQPVPLPEGPDEAAASGHLAGPGDGASRAAPAPKRPVRGPMRNPAVAGQSGGSTGRRAPPGAPAPPPAPSPR